VRIVRAFGGLVLAGVVGTAAIVVGDRVVGRLADPTFVPLAGPPGVDRPLDTPEFHVRARTNADGFRGAPLPGAKPPATVRVVVLGDSFTFGYGVRERQAYPARLARRLVPAARPCRLEVVNLGVAGAGPLDYLHHLEHTAARLDPDVVLVGVFANDPNDLYQLRRFHARSAFWALPSLRRPAAAGPEGPWRGMLTRMAPNLRALLGRARDRLAPTEARAAGGASAVSTSPETVVAALGRRYGDPHGIAARHAALASADRAAVDRLLAGVDDGADARPRLLLSALVEPDAVSDALLLRSPGRRAALEETAAVLARIADGARALGAVPVFAVLPAGEQVADAPGVVGSRRWSSLAAAGFRLTPALLSAAPLSDAVRRVAATHDAGFVDLVPAFRRRGGDGLYFEVDEHWTARGQALAATVIARRLAPAVREACP
jgi:lysophospholipase L1-like esterase